MRSRRTRRTRHHRRRHRKYRGGSATNYVYDRVGSMDSQLNRTFSTSGPYASNPSNDLIGVNGQGSEMKGMPSQQSLQLIQSAGRRRRHGRKPRRHSRYRKRRGGSIAEPLAALGLLYAQQKFRSKSRRR